MFQIQANTTMKEISISTKFRSESRYNRQPILQSRFIRERNEALFKYADQNQGITGSQYYNQGLFVIGMKPYLSMQIRIKV